MTRRRSVLILILLALLTLNGCGSAVFERSGAFGAAAVIKNPNAAQIDLVKALQELGVTLEKDADIGQAYMKAVRSAGYTKEQRNILQGAIVGASDVSCREYGIFLNKLDTEVGFTLGAITTALAGAAAVIKPVDTARALAALAGVTSGVDAEFSSKFFAKQAVPVITRAIQVSRQRLRVEMDGKRSSETDVYTIADAVNDAIRYHAECTLVAGLAEAGRAVDRTGVGVKEVEDLLTSSPLFSGLLARQRWVEVGRAQGALDELDRQLARVKKVVSDGGGQVALLKSAALKLGAPQQTTANAAIADAEKELKESQELIKKQESAATQATQEANESLKELTQQKLSEEELQIATAKVTAHTGNAQRLARALSRQAKTIEEKLQAARSSVTPTK